MMELRSCFEAHEEIGKATQCWYDPAREHIPVPAVDSFAAAAEAVVPAVEGTDADPVEFAQRTVVLADLEHHTAVVPVDLELCTVAAPVDLEQRTVAVFVDLEQRTVAAPVDLDQRTVAAPVDLEHCTAAAPVDLDQRTVAAPVDLEHCTAAVPVDFVHRTAAVPADLEQCTVVVLAGLEQRTVDLQRDTVESAAAAHKEYIVVPEGSFHTVAVLDVAEGGKDKMKGCLHSPAASHIWRESSAAHTPLTAWFLSSTYWQ
jgi:hypothetical protein